MIDLHSHTTNSDGTWTTKELLMKAEKLFAKAAELGVKVIDEMEFYTIVKYDINSKKQSIETTEDSVADLWWVINV